MSTVLSDHALADLEMISDEYLPRRRRQWKMLQSEFHKRFKVLESNPRMGYDSGYLMKGLRRIVIRPYIVYYLHTAGPTIVIMRVVHGARDIDSAFFDGSTE